MSEIDTSLAALRALAIKLDDVYPHKDSDGWIIDETVYALRALADEKEAAGNDATLATVRARLLAAEEARDAARSEAKDEAAEFIFGVLEDALGHPAYSPCDGSETWDGDVAGTVYCILNASGLRNADTGELATARAERAEQERDAAITDTHDTIEDLRRSLEAAEAERDELRRTVDGVNVTLRRAWGQDVGGTLADVVKANAERDAAIARAEKAEAEWEALSTKVDRMTEHAKARDKRI